MSFETVSDLRVRYAETDQMGVVYYANYLIWCEIGRTDFIRALGASYAQLEREGIRLAVSAVALRYHGSARYDDDVRVLTRLTSVGSRGMTFSYRILRIDNAALLVSGSTDLVSLSATGRPAAIPGTLRDLLRVAVTSDAEPTARPVPGPRA